MIVQSPFLAKWHFYFIGKESHAQKLFKYSILACIILLSPAEAYCGKRTDVAALEGTIVVLGPKLDEAQEILMIMWIKENALEIAEIQYDNKTVSIKSENLDITVDGILTINDFMVDDEGIYTVVIKRFNQPDCQHDYYVTISDKSPCGKAIDVSGSEEDKITLQMNADSMSVKIIYWFSPSGDLLAKTKPGVHVQIQNRYTRGVQVLQDGSLTIMRLSVKDQGVYTANIHMYSGTSCSRIYNVTISDRIPEVPAINNVHVYSTEEKDLTLPLPEHLLDEVEDVYWMKDYAKHIAITYRNGSLQVLHDRFRGRLRSTNDGSLVIRALRIADRGKYSADIHLRNNNLYTEAYHVRVYRKSYYVSLGTLDVNATEMEDLVLPNEIKNIKTIDWLTARWIRFAVTKQDGDICILDHTYSNRLGGLYNGSLTIEEVSKEDEGLYRAYIYLHDGVIMEQQYSVRVSENIHLYIFYLLCAIGGLLTSIILLIIGALRCHR